MRTRVVTVDPNAPGPWPEIEELARLVDDGGLVAVPTETVYGIAVNVRDEAAMRRLAQARGRSNDAAPTIHLPDPGRLVDELRHVPPAARRLIDRFWPGPLTVVLSDRHGRPTAFRVPDLGVTRAFLRAATCRVAAAGAGPAGGPSARTAEEVLEHFDGVLDGVLDAGPCRHGAASSVVRVEPEGGVEVLREGVIPGPELLDAAAHTLLFVCSANRCRSPLAAALATKLLARRQAVDPWDLVKGGYRVLSAGTGCLHGSPATPEAEAAASDRGLDLSAHRAQPLTPSLLEQADRIFVMTRGHRESILEFAPETAERISLLDRRGRDIPDPYGKGRDVYGRTTEILLRCLQSRLDDM